VDLHRHTVTAADGTALRLYEAPSPPTDEAVLHLHGAITHAQALFAPPVDGDASYSWLHANAARGRAAFALDVRGYGESDPLEVYDDPPDANEPPVRARDAARDVHAAVEFVADRYETVHLVGVSWGTMTAGAYLESYGNDRVASLVQCGPVYRSPLDFADVVAGLGLGTDLGAWFVDDYETVRERQGGGGPVFEAVWSAMVDSPQGLADRNAYRAQTGAFADTRGCCADDPPYDAGAIEVPTLVVRGSADETAVRADALACYDENGARGDAAEYAEIAGAGHYVMHGPRRQALYAGVASFFDRV
jgi:pimeloyl-ACP methyl ester carboxylesterase